MIPARTALPDPTSRGFDADDHYYEAEDAFTRHMDRFIPNPTFDPVAKPGSLDEYFRNRNPKGREVRARFGDPRAQTTLGGR